MFLKYVRFFLDAALKRPDVSHLQNIKKRVLCLVPVD